MDKSYFIELTGKLYRLTFLFPAKEPLRHKIREIGDEILSNLVLILEGEMVKRKESAFCVERDIEIMDALLELAKTQNWVDSEAITKIQEKYREIKMEVEEFNDILRRKSALYEQKALLLEDKEDRFKEERETEREKPKEKKEEKEKKKPEVKLNDRQEKILRLLMKKQKMQVKDFQGALPKTTKRTLRRDLSALTKKKLTKRAGSGNTTYYLPA